MKIAGVLLLSSLSLLAPPASAQDVERGKLLYETHCGACHYERVHQRLRPAVRDLDQLRDMVARWAPQTKHRFTLDEQEAVVQYLNESHYRFGLAPKRKSPAKGA
jgi:mono/diheme cytochrome c family protein